jgi:hypothetical protein
MKTLLITLIAFLALLSYKKTKLVVALAQVYCPIYSLQEDFLANANDVCGILSLNGVDGQDLIVNNYFIYINDQPFMFGDSIYIWGYYHLYAKKGDKVRFGFNAPQPISVELKFNDEVVIARFDDLYSVDYTLYIP